MISVVAAAMHVLWLAVPVKYGGLEVRVYIHVRTFSVASCEERYGGVSQLVRSTTLITIIMILDRKRKFIPEHILR